MLGLWSKNVLRWPSGLLDKGFVTFSYDEDETLKTEGTQSVALYSADLNNWSSTNLNVPITWKHVCYFNNEFIAFGGNFSLVSSSWEVVDAYLAYSTDGKTWDVQKYNNNATGSGLKFAKNTLARTVSSASHNGVLVVSGPKTGIAWTTDGRKWEHFQHGGDVQMYGRDVIYAQDKFVRLGSGKLNWWSSDGRTWNTFATGLDGDTGVFMVFGNGVWLALNSKGQCIKSTNGTSWSNATSIPFSDSHLFSGIAFANGFFLVAAITGDVTDFYRSADGTNWVRYRIGGNYDLERITHNDKFLSIYNDVIYTGPDGVSWTTIGKLSGLMSKRTPLGKVGFPG